VFVIHQSDLSKEEKVISSLPLEFPSLTLEEKDPTPVFPPDVISIEQAIQSVIQRYPGRVIRAELLFSERGIVYEVDVESSNDTIIVIAIDAQTGQVLGPLPELDQGKNPPFSLDDENEI